MSIIMQENSQHQSVSDFLHHCYLDQYLDIFLSEGFDSVNSLLEITEEDMIFMNVKRGHRRLIQREIANVKGVPRNQPLITNMMGPKYGQELIDEPIITRPSNSNNHNSSGGNFVATNSIPPYESLATGLTSPRSMNSGVGSGNNSSSGPMTSLRTRPNLSRQDINSGTDSSSSQPTNLNIISNNPIVIQNNGNNSARSNSISSNDDDDSIDTNETTPTTKRKYRRHAKPDRHAPIKPPSAYIMFSNDSRAKLKDRNLSFSELAKIVGDQWKNLNNVDRQRYERMAMRAKDEYLAALERYRQTPQYHHYQEYLNDFKAKQNAANRLISRARKRAKQASPGSGSFADSSSNGNSNGNGSSGSGSADAYEDQESVIRRQQRTSDEQPRKQQKLEGSNNQAQYSDYQSDEADSINQPKQQQQQPSSDSGYTSQTCSSRSSSQRPQWNHRSNQIMRGMLPVEFVHHIPPPPPIEVRPESAVAKKGTPNKDQADRQISISNRRRSPRINKSRST